MAHTAAAVAARLDAGSDSMAARIGLCPQSEIGVKSPLQLGRVGSPRRQLTKPEVLDILAISGEVMKRGLTRTKLAVTGRRFTSPRFEVSVIFQLGRVASGA